MKKYVKIGSIILLILVIVYLFINLVMYLVMREAKEVDVPDLTGLALGDAYERLTSKELFLQKVGEQFNTDIAAGSIISQMPPAGTKVKTGRRIKVIVSLGSEKVTVPQIVGQTLRQAEIVLRNAGLSAGEVLRVYSTQLYRDRILWQEPGAQSSVEKGTPVNLMVCDGPIKTDSVMPNLLSRKLDQAEIIIKFMGLKIDSITTEVNDNIESRTIVKQTPEPNSLINESTSVSLVVSIKTGEDRGSPAIKIIHFEVAQGLLEKRVRILLTDEMGEREVYNQMQAPGSKINLAVSAKGAAKVKIYVNEILAEERDL